MPPSFPPPSSWALPYCPAELLIHIEPRVAEPTVSGSVNVEPLQEPAYPDPLVRPPGSALPDPNRDPATWNRAEIPAGACVFRLEGVNSDTCYLSGGEFFTGSCAALSAGGPKIAPASYYDVARCDVRPGCPSAEPYADAPGYWWYFSESGLHPNGAPFSDLVICAPECANSFAQGGCLRLRPNGSRCDQG